jgi:hypothetical protein
VTGNVHAPQPFPSFVASSSYIAPCTLLINTGNAVRLITFSVSRDVDEDEDDDDVVACYEGDGVTSGQPRKRRRRSQSASQASAAHHSGDLRAVTATITSSSSQAVDEFSYPPTVEHLLAQFRDRAWQRRFTACVKCVRVCNVRECDTLSREGTQSLSAAQWFDESSTCHIAVRVNVIALVMTYASDCVRVSNRHATTRSRRTRCQRA